MKPNRKKVLNNWKMLKSKLFSPKNLKPSFMPEI
nr:MAG TPA_asm: hypothetical protein [Caudoviricetes sp.]DAL39821.1 MAG TPA_asm: hypothetical protein [Caudoviricetes sp.]